MSSVVTALSTGLSDELIYFVIYDLVHLVATFVIVYLGYFIINKTITAVSKGKTDV